LTIVYQLLKEKKEYHELGPNYNEDRKRTQVTKQEIRKLESLGYKETIGALIKSHLPNGNWVVGSSLFLLVLSQMLGWGPAAFPHMTHDFLYLYVSRILALAPSKFLNPYAFRFITFVWLLIPSKKPFV